VTKSLGLYQKNVQLGINGGELRGQLAIGGSPGKMAIKMQCMCVL